MLGCCLVSLHFRCYILSSRSVWAHCSLVHLYCAPGYIANNLVWPFNLLLLGVIKFQPLMELLGPASTSINRTSCPFVPANPNVPRVGSFREETQSRIFENGFECYQELSILRPQSQCKTKPFHDTTSAPSGEGDTTGSFEGDAITVKKFTRP